MDRKSLGLLGALLAAVAALRPGPPAAAQPPKPQPPFNAPAAVTASQNCVSDASDPDGPWKALCRYFGPPETSNDPKAHAGRWSCVPGNGPVTFLIAAVPDPEITNLALYFDRVLESLMWAIGDTGYTFEQYWLPWSNRPAMPLTTLSDWNCQRKNLEQRSEQPGVLVFRLGVPPEHCQTVRHASKRDSLGRSQLFGVLAPFGGRTEPVLRCKPNSENQRGVGRGNQRKRHSALSKFPGRSS